MSVLSFIGNQEDFWVVLSECLQGLPPHMADLFLLQEYENLSAEQLCKVFDIQTTNNCMGDIVSRPNAIASLFGKSLV